MITLTTYEIYISGKLPQYSFSGDIDPTTQQITVVPQGSAVIQIDLSGLVDSSGQPATFAAAPISFSGAPAQPDWVAWALLSPTTILLLDMNAAVQSLAFVLATADGGKIQIARGGRLASIDPTIVNTYGPPDDGGAVAREPGGPVSKI